MVAEARQLIIGLAVCLLAACGGGGGSPAAPRYTIGGSINGLTASGLLLADNGSDMLTVPAGATSFVFPLAISSGSGYSVAVQTQPSGETCSVNQGVGTADGNITTINVQCTPNTYTIGGSISGLTGSDLVLLDNGGNPLNVAAGASSFTFSSSISSGGSYAVSVQTQPAGENCSVGNGSGTATSNVTGIAISCVVVATYSIAGGISGLTGSGLVLLDNGGDALSVPANAASFAFSSTVNSGSVYAVSIRSQPTGGSCSVSNGSGTANTNVTSVTINCTSSFSSAATNVVSLTVGPGAGDANSQTFNIPQVTVTICEPGTATCATIPNVMVDTGSSGLRIMASVLSSQGVTLPAMADPSLSNNTIQECLPFADGYTWGQVSEANVTIGGESTASSIPIQVINDGANPNPAAPSGCTGSGVSLNSVDSFDANGILGVSTAIQDCGNVCQNDASTDVYWTCTTSATCTSTTLVVADQVADPVASFPTDNNGVIVQMPAIPADGSLTANGYLVFGVGTEGNNGLGAATVLTTSTAGEITTNFNGRSLPGSFIDSGSNALFFNDSSLPACTFAPAFYCPGSTASLSASNEGQNGATTTVSFQVADLGSISNNNFAIDDVAGPAGPISGFPPYFDWGLPFFYGRTVFVAIEGKTAGSTMGPYFAY